jgi:hypothetical protein
VNIFPIRPVDRCHAEAVEILGSKPKFWFSEGNGADVRSWRGVGRNLLDSQRKERLTTKDAKRTVRAFCERGRSAVYRTAADLRPLGLVEAFQAFVQ